MPIFAPELNSGVRKKKRKGRPVRPDRSIERKYRNRLFRVNRTLQDEYLQLARLIRDGRINQPDALRRLDQVEDALTQRGIARGIATDIVTSANDVNRERTQNMFKNVFGIDVFGIVDDLGLSEKLDGMTQENVGLITSMPRDSLGRARAAINSSFRGEELPRGSLLAELQKIGQVTKNRARLIARDQTSKLNASINQSRQQAIGIDSYIWRNSKDERVVGNPSGLYPKGNPKHMNHWDREGKEFMWDNPPPDGHPGIPIQCR
jgi:uncharacterized protein with gpF-like domain